jgi:hypothetical protein
MSKKKWQDNELLMKALWIAVMSLTTALIVKKK